MAHLHKAWKVLFVLCGLAAAAIGISVNTSGVFYSVVAEELGLLRGSFAFHMTIFSLVTAVSALFVPKLMKKIPFKILLAVSIIIAVIGTGLMAASTELWQFYLLGAIRGFSTGLFSVLTITMVINHWFMAKNGLATSIALGFSGIMGAVFSPVFSAIITAFGWQLAYVAEAGLILLLCLPSLCYPFTLEPKNEGLTAYGSLEQLEQPPLAVPYRSLSLTLLAMLVFSIIVSFISSMTQHLPGYAETAGLSTTVGAGLLSMGMIGNIVSKLIVGALSDKIGSVRASFVLLAANTAGTLLLLLGKPASLMLLAAFLFGSCYGLGAVSVPLVTRTVFGNHNYAKRFPIISFAGNTGAALAFSAIGYIYDFTGSYTAAFILIIVLLVLSFLALLAANRS
ncbi:MFS transporter [Streptococcus chenjunshii]|uniref:MFS transporter n=1 Tax=Streptococcus chenjunshii TaxID=2173853 RepID=A0A372KRF7_9STRE|nr:MFS transporter [Streptococcus chenjunshii]AXQ78503.1 MFS transporter [Streptococcus chenjunshii]RFU52036.1 MFS transporter [Streptococcus chenjunshii]RFU54228.1 MFS transporter [Streptococcus chenjunshii]